MKGIYFATLNCDCDFVKIGQTKDVISRFSKSTDTPYDFEILGFRPVDNQGEENYELRDALEKNYHIEFEEFRHRGEWFHLTSEILDTIDHVNQESGFKPFVISKCIKIKPTQSS